MSKKRLFKVSAACAGILLGLGLMQKLEAVQINTDAGKIKNCGGTCYYKAAYEYYGNQAVIAGNGTLGEDPVRISIITGQQYSPGNSSSVQLTGGFFIDPSKQDSRANAYCLYNGSAIVATPPTTWSPSWPTNQLFFNFTSSVPANTSLTLVLCNATGNDQYGNSSMIQIAPNLGASCTQTAEVKIAWNFGNDCCNGTLIKIEPKKQGKAKLNFDAELDANFDFAKFVNGTVGATILDLCCDRGASSSCNCTAGSCTSNPNIQSTSDCGDKWVLGKNFDPAVGSIVKANFKLYSEAPQKGVKEIRLKNDPTKKCTKDSDNQWTCNFDCIPCPSCPEGKFLELEVDGATENNLTLWYVKDVNITGFCPTDPRVKDVCCYMEEGYAGAWWGGLESIVPFVKRSPDGSYDTFIKFINRYGKEAKVFAQPFKNATGTMIFASVEVGSIPANGGVLQITATDLKNKFGLTDEEMDKGMAFKFLIRVPSQAGCGSFSGTVQGYSSVSGTTCNINPNDPYVEGIVVSASPVGQRTVPLKFKYWKNGAYSH